MSETGTGTAAKQWFVVHTYSGFENKVATGIESRARIFGLQDMIGRVIVPTEKVREIRKSKKIETEQKFFPGYLLVEMELTDDTWHLVRSTPKVTGFVGSGSKPVAGWFDGVAVSGMIKYVRSHQGGSLEWRGPSHREVRVERDRLSR